MRRAGPWIAIGAATVVVALLAIVFAPQQESSPFHESGSDAADGTSALYYYAQSLGHPVDRLQGRFDPAGRGILFVFSPSQPFTGSESRRLVNWVGGGGVLVYASDGDAELDLAFGVGRQNQLVLGPALAPAPLLEGVTRVEGSPLLRPLRTSPDQVALLRSTADLPLAFTTPRGAGRVVVLTDPVMLENDHLAAADNGRFAADLLSLAGAAAPVSFDEFHHGAQASSSPTDFLLTRWGLALLWAMAVFCLGVVLRSRRLGPRLPLSPSGGRPVTDYTGAVGALLRRSRARGLTLEVVDLATRRAVAERVGLGRDAAHGDLPRLLRERAPAIAESLADAEAGLEAAKRSEGSLLAAARALHHLSYPVEEATEQTR